MPNSEVSRRTNQTKHLRQLLQKIRFYTLKLPLMLVLICLGYILDFLTQLPFMVICAAAAGPRRGAAGSSPGRENKDSSGGPQSK